MIDYQDHALLLNESYRHWMGEYLVEQRDPGEVLAALNVADCVLLSLGLGSRPIFNYGNLQALSLFGYEHLDFLQLPVDRTIPAASKYTDLTLIQQLESVGVVRNPSVTFVAKSGGQFAIDRGVVWKVVDNLGRHHGHAARLDEWHFLEID